MKITIDDYTENEVSLEEFLEPTFRSFQIIQGAYKINISEYQAKELRDALKFLLERGND